MNGKGAAHDARRDEVYLEVVGEQERPPCVQSFDEAIMLISLIAHPIVLAGTAARRAYEKLRDAELSNVLQPDALWVARLALKMRWNCIRAAW